MLWTGPSQPVQCGLYKAMLLPDTIPTIFPLSKKAVKAPTKKRGQGNWPFSNRFRIDFKILLITYKILNGLAPLYLCQLIKRKSSSQYNLRSARDDMLLNYPVCRTKITLGDRAFEFAAPKLCNALPLNIRKSTSLTVFKQLLKTHFFCMAFYWYCCDVLLLIYFLIYIFLLLYCTFEIVNL